MITPANLTLDLFRNGNNPIVLNLLTNGQAINITGWSAQFKVASDASMKTVLLALTATPNSYGSKSEVTNGATGEVTITIALGDRALFPVTQTMGKYPFQLVMIDGAGNQDPFVVGPLQMIEGVG